MPIAVTYVHDTPANRILERHRIEELEQHEQAWREEFDHPSVGFQAHSIWSETKELRRLLACAINARGIDSRLGVADHKLADCLIQEILTALAIGPDKHET